MTDILFQVGSLIGAGVGIMMLFVFLGLILLGGIIFFFVFWILMIVDCAQRKFKNETDKIVWILLLIFLQLIGAILYYFIVKRRAN